MIYKKLYNKINILWIYHFKRKSWITRRMKLSQNHNFQMQTVFQPLLYKILNVRSDLSWCHIFHVKWNKFRRRRIIAGWSHSCKTSRDKTKQKCTIWNKNKLMNTVTHYVAMSMFCQQNRGYQMPRWWRKKFRYDLRIMVENFSYFRGGVGTVTP